MKQIRVRLTFISEILGTQPGNQAIHSTYVASKAPDAEKMADEVAAIGAEMVTEKTMTIFPQEMRSSGPIRSADFSRAHSRR